MNDIFKETVNSNESPGQIKNFSNTLYKLLEVVNNEKVKIDKLVLYGADSENETYQKRTEEINKLIEEINKRTEKYYESKNEKDREKLESEFLGKTKQILGIIYRNDKLRKKAVDNFIEYYFKNKDRILRNEGDSQ